MSPARVNGPAQPRGRLADEVARRIADAIVLGVFPPGTRLDEHMLAGRYEVSRTPVREALKQLGSTGLVVTRPNRGSVVAALTPEQIDQTFEAMGELEAACARHAAVRMNDAERDRLRELHRLGREAMQAGDADRYDALNDELHLLVLHGAHNPVLTEAALALRHRVTAFRRTQFRHIERLGESFAEHTVVVEALLARDALAAYREMRGHLLAARGGAARVSPAWGTVAAGERDLDLLQRSPAR